jgi:hypothetical protein
MTESIYWHIYVSRHGRRAHRRSHLVHGSPVTGGTDHTPQSSPPDERSWYFFLMRYLDMSRLFAQTTALVAIVTAACSGSHTLATSGTHGDANGSGGSGDTGDAGSSDARASGSCESTFADASSGLAGDARVPLYHRPSPACCPSERGPGPAGQPYPHGVASTCASDSECTAGVNGRCFPSAGLLGLGGCSYDECFTDSDCGSGETCRCRASLADNSANTCVRGGNCIVDSDCGPGGYCSPSVGQSCMSPHPYFCHTPVDTCTDDSDCPTVDPKPSSCPIITPCAFDLQEQRWACAQLTCCPP